jgi:hypothetical protein
MSLESELLRSGTNCRPQQNPLQTVGLSKTFLERSGKRRNSLSQTWNNKSKMSSENSEVISNSGEKEGKKMKAGCQKQA